MIFLPFYSLSWILLCCLDEIFTMALTPYSCNLSSVCLEMFRSSGAENPSLQPAFAGDCSSHWSMLKEIHWTKRWNVYLVSRPETFCACEPANHPAKAGKLRSIFIKGVKIQKMSNSSVKHVYLSFRLAKEVKVELSLCFFLIPRKSILGFNLVSTLISWGAVAHLLMHCTAWCWIPVPCYCEGHS